MGSLTQFEEYAGALLRGHLSAGKSIGRIGLVEAGENTNYFFHNPNFGISENKAKLP